MLPCPHPLRKNESQSLSVQQAILQKSTVAQLMQWIGIRLHLFCWFFWAWFNQILHSLWMKELDILVLCWHSAAVRGSNCNTRFWICAWAFLPPHQWRVQRRMDAKFFSAEGLPACGTISQIQNSHNQTMSTTPENFQKPLTQWDAYVMTALINTAIQTMLASSTISTVARTRTELRKQ